MPSRIRICLQIGGAVITGAGAIQRLKATPSGSKLKDFNKPNWTVLDTEGRKQGLWAGLRVWRERRGLDHTQSVYHSQSGRKGMELTPIRRARENALRRRSTLQEVLLRRSMQSRSRGISLDEVSSRRPARPGIFA